MPVISVQQFKEALEQLNYAPRHSRNTKDSQAAELFNRGGEKINNIKLKFLIQDDGGTWDDGTIIRPDFIWDFKKIVSGYVIDNGIATNRLDLFLENVKQTDDGVYFLGHDTSYGKNDIAYSMAVFDNDYALFNIWFTPEYEAGGGILFRLMVESRSVFTVSLSSIDTDYYTIGLRAKLTADDNFATSLPGPFRFGYKQNIQVYFSSGDNKVYTYHNGKLITTTNISSGLFYAAANSYVITGQGYKGEISYITLNFSANPISDTIIKNFYLFQYPLPRKKEYVDLSQEFEKDARNLLIDVNSVEKAIESLKGQLYVKTNNITLKD